MKKFIKKIEKSRLYFTIFMAVVFTLFLFIINDIALVSDKFNGLIHDCSILFDELDLTSNSSLGLSLVISRFLSPSFS